MTREDAQAAWEKIVDTGFSNYELLTEDQKVWFNIEPLTLGGIIDHFINNGAEHNQDTIKALEFLGFNDIAELIRNVNALFTNGQPPADINDRNEQWDTWCDKYQSLLDEVDEKFWRRNKDLENSLMEHINRTQIGVA
ncbi:MAG: DUF4375 domain-containing protein [Bacteroidota bacterium]